MCSYSFLNLVQNASLIHNTAVTFFSHFNPRGKKKYICLICQFWDKCTSGYYRIIEVMLHRIESSNHSGWKRPLRSSGPTTNTSRQPDTKTRSTWLWEHFQRGTWKLGAVPSESIPNTIRADEQEGCRSSGSSPAPASPLWVITPKREQLFWHNQADRAAIWHSILEFLGHIMHPWCGLLSATLVWWFK